MRSEQRWILSYDTTAADSYTTTTLARSCNLVETSTPICRCRVRLVSTEIRKDFVRAREVSGAFNRVRRRLREASGIYLSHRNGKRDTRSEPRRKWRGQGGERSANGWCASAAQWKMNKSRVNISGPIRAVSMNTYRLTPPKWRRRRLRSFISARDQCCLDQASGRLRCSHSRQIHYHRLPTRSLSPSLAEVPSFARC